MRIVSITLFFSLLCPPLFGDSQPVGRHIGYLIGEYFSDSAISLDAIITGIRAFRSEPHLNESRNMHSYFSLALIIISCASVLFILYIAIMQPYYL